MANENTLTLPVVSYDGKKVKDISLPAELFQAEIHEYSVQRAVRVDLANRRVATAHTLTRDIVHGSNRKPFRQKGTGRGRQGTVNSPLHRHGGVVFAPNGKQSFKLKMNKREHDLAFASVMTDKAAGNNLIVLTAEKFNSNKTKDGKKMLESIGAEGKVLLVLGEMDENLILSLRNLPSVILTTADNVSVYDVLNADKLVLVESTIPTEEDHDHDAKEAK